jgi:hypothetical protein
MAARLLCLVAFAALVSQTGSNLMAAVGLPGSLIPLSRDGLLLLLAARAIQQADFFKSRSFYIGVVLCLFVITADIVVAAVTDQHMAGLYYGRLYLLPVIFAIAARTLLLHASPQALQGAVRFFFWSGFVVILVALALFVAIEVQPTLLSVLMRSAEGEQLATAWYIAGGVWLRMGLPATSPNAMGLAMAFYLMLIVPVMIRGRMLAVGRVFGGTVTLLALLALLMTFSRSSWLGLMLGTFLIFMLCRQEWGMGGMGVLLKVAATGLVLIVLLGVALALVDSYSGGFISSWIELNTQGTDPSMQGHSESFTQAFEALSEYFWLGYPKGSVGARAMLFGGEAHNVENSFLILFYEMGVPMGMAYLGLIAFLLKELSVHKSQLAVLAIFGVCCMFLPYVFEPEIVAMFLVTYTLLGRAMQLADQRDADGVSADNTPVLPAPLKKKARTGFQPTVFEPR